MSTTISNSGKEMASILDHLAQAFASMGQGVRKSDGSVDTWSHGKQVYVDATIPNLASERLDICLHDGRIFVVLERS